MLTCMYSQTCNTTAGHQGGPAAGAGGRRGFGGARHRGSVPRQGHASGHFRTGQLVRTLRGPHSNPVQCFAGHRADFPHGVPRAPGCGHRDGGPGLRPQNWLQEGEPPGRHLRARGLAGGCFSSNSNLRGHGRNIQT